MERTLHNQRGKKTLLSLTLVWPWRISSGTKLDNETSQDSKPPMFFLTAVTRILAIARFLCEYSGPFWGMFSKIRLEIEKFLYVQKQLSWYFDYMYSWWVPWSDPQKTHSHRPVMPVDFVVFFNVQDCDALKRFPVVCFLKFNVHLNETKFERNSAVFQVWSNDLYWGNKAHKQKKSLGRYKWLFGFIKVATWYLSSPFVFRCTSPASSNWMSFSYKATVCPPFTLVWIAIFPKYSITMSFNNYSECLKHSII